MRRWFSIGAIGFVALVGCAGFVNAQSAKKIRLPTGEYVYDLGGEWDALIESYSRAAGDGAFSNVVKITQIGGTCPATGVITYPIIIRGNLLKDNPLHTPAAAGSEIIRLGFEFDGVNKCCMVSVDGKEFSCTWEISEDGNKINVEAPNHGKMTLVRK
jgi:hypothetical protein